MKQQIQTAIVPQPQQLTDQNSTFLTVPVHTKQNQIQLLLLLHHGFLISQIRDETKIQQDLAPIHGIFKTSQTKPTSASVIRTSKPKPLQIPHPYIDYLKLKWMKPKSEFFVSHSSGGNELDLEQKLKKSENRGRSGAESNQGED